MAKDRKESLTRRFQFVQDDTNLAWIIITAKWLKYATKEIVSLRGMYAFTLNRR
jgi:hypothetical protein